jgi:ABC-type cobalamin/Fe3+-siderophores transport system ATPase subunit
MLIVGYQGIGKSTISNSITSMIDLESGNFWVNGKRNDDWYKVYVNIAEHLSNQGYTVFLSSHKVVREELNRREVLFAVICPSLEMKATWIARLKARYEHSMKGKDYKAWKNAEQCYDENIKDLMSEKICCTIDSASYDLGDIVSKVEYNLRKEGGEE